MTTACFWSAAFCFEISAWRGIVSTNVFHEWLLKTDFELADLAVLVILELVHVFLQLLTFFFGGVLLVLRGLDSGFEVGDGLFECFDFSPDLKKKSAQNGGIKEQHVLSLHWSLQLAPPADASHAP
jgi:hypothetical protein